MLIEIKSFVFEITYSWLYIQVPFIGALFVGKGLPTVFDRWSEVKRSEKGKSIKDFSVI